MKKQINLIPHDLAVPLKTTKLGNYLNRISTIGAIVFISIVVILIAGLTYFNFKYKGIVEEVETLKGKILNLENSEQKLVLSKDRLSKISTIRKDDAIDTEFSNFEKFYNIMISIPGTTFSDIVMTPKQTDATVKFQDSAALNSAIAAVYTLTDYKGITLTSLGYNQGSGYYITLVFKD